MGKKAFVTTVVNEREITIPVDRGVLAERLQMAARVAKHAGRRPGEPTDLTKTSSDPISSEKATTLHVMRDSIIEKA